MLNGPATWPQTQTQTQRQRETGKGKSKAKQQQVETVLAPCLRTMGNLSLLETCSQKGRAN